MYGPFAVFIQPYKRLMLLGILALGVAQASGAVIPLQIKEAINSIDAPSLIGLELDSLLKTYLMHIAGLALLAAVSRYIMRRLLGYSSNRIEYDIRTHYFSHLLKLPLSYYQKHHTGDLMSRATNDLVSVHVFFTYGLRSLVDASLTLVVSLCLMFTISWKLTLIVLAPLPLLSMCVLRMSPLVHHRFKEIQEFFGQMSNFIQENLSGIRVIKAYVQGPTQVASFDELNQTYLRKNQRLIRTRAVYHPVFFLMASIGLGLTLWFGGRAVAGGTMNIGEFVAFNAYLTLLIRPFSWAGWMIDRTQRAIVAMRRINEVVEVEPEIEDGEDLVVGRQLTGHISLRNLTFSYEDKPVLQGINLDIPAGSTLGLIGKVGSGKTTLARLIPRLIESVPGQVLVDGVSVEQWPMDALREAIGYVSQVPFLFSDSIAANISYGVGQISQEKIQWAAQLAHIAEEIEELDDGFQTVIGERGVTLSGGQKQRTTLARALARSPRILILDDALSGVDTHTEEIILGHLREIMKGRTTIIIAHRISTLRDADHIVVLDEGSVIEQGNHDQLVRRNGVYGELYQQQQLAAELERL